MTHTEAANGLLRVIAGDELPYGKIARKFEGYRYGDVEVSFFLVDSRPGVVRCCTPTPTRRSS